MKAFSKNEENVKTQFKVICTGADKQYLKYKEEIEIFCEKNNIDILITRFNTMCDAYEIADLVVLPSQSESFGYSALESLSIGIPTILNNIPTYNEVSIGSKNYYLFNNTVENLYSSLLVAINNGLERVKQPNEWQNQYSIILFGQRYLNLLIK